MFLPLWAELFRLKVLNPPCFLFSFHFGVTLIHENPCHCWSLMLKHTAWLFLLTIRMVSASYFPPSADLNLACPAMPDYLVIWMLRHRHRALFQHGRALSFILLEPIQWMQIRLHLTLYEKPKLQNPFRHPWAKAISATMSRKTQSDLKNYMNMEVQWNSKQQAWSEKVKKRSTWTVLNSIFISEVCNEQG